MKPLNDWGAQMLWRIVDVFLILACFVLIFNMYRTYVTQDQLAKDAPFIDERSHIYSLIDRNKSMIDDIYLHLHNRPREAKEEHE